MFENANALGADRFLFKHQKEYGQLAADIATIQQLGKSLSDKLPKFAENKCLITRRAYEQCTSEGVANFKANLISGNRLLVLGGGIGIDEMAFSSQFKAVISIEPSQELNDYSIFNFNRLHISNIERITSTAEDYLDHSATIFDCIYTDPDRRSGQTRQILLKDHQPNIIELLPKIKSRCKKLIVKCSPLYDYEMAIKELPSVKDIYAISQDGEMKELLLICDFEDNAIKTQLHCVDVEVHAFKQISFPIDSNQLPEYDNHLSGVFFYEAGASLVKMRKHHDYAAVKKLSLYDKSVPFYHSLNEENNFIGRKFRIVSTQIYKGSDCLKYFENNQITKANIKVRGLNFDTEAARKKLKLKDGGEHYIFIFPYKGDKLMVHCKK